MKKKKKIVFKMLMNVRAYLIQLFYKHISIYFLYIKHFA